MRVDNAPALKPTGIIAARKAVKAIAALDVLLDDLRPSDAEAHPDSTRGRAWSALLGTAARLVLRADELLRMESPPKPKRRPFINRGRTAKSASAAPSSVECLR